ncbi:MAG TPA: MFS transporter [Bacillota bacterium]|nr:MFS transporter [Bacillota bacterium]
MASEIKTTHIIQSFKTLKGNSRVSVIFEPLWGIPYVLYTFYLSLYMKDQGITDTQLGYLISIGFLASIFFSMFGGFITDRLGRKKTTLIFDLLAWPVSLLFYLIFESFWMFALAQVINGMARITAVSWNLMVVEDAEVQEQVAAYNLLNAINISVGIFTPLAGILVNYLGIINGEKFLLGFAVISMTAMILFRNHYFRETKVGREILDERKQHLKQQPNKQWKFDLSLLQSLKRKPMIIMALALSILFNAYIPIGTFSSLYYAPFLTEVLKLDKSAISILGGISAMAMLFVFAFLTPRLSHRKRFSHMAVGLVFQILALFMFITIPSAQFWPVIISVVLFALGYGVVKPFNDSVLAEVTAGKERAGIYAIHNTAVSISSAGMGVASGYLYKSNPDLIYVISIWILIVCIGFLAWLGSFQKKAIASNINSPSSQI